MRNARVTISIEPDIRVQIKELQADFISLSSKSISFSKVLNQVLREGLAKKEDIKIAHENKRITRFAI